jgi:hypothetical protein
VPSDYRLFRTIEAGQTIVKRFEFIRGQNSAHSEAASVGTPAGAGGALGVGTQAHAASDACDALALAWRDDRRARQ